MSLLIASLLGGKCYAYNNESERWLQRLDSVVQQRQHINEQKRHRLFLVGSGIPAAMAGEESCGGGPQGYGTIETRPAAVPGEAPKRICGSPKNEDRALRERNRS